MEYGGSEEVLVWGNGSRGGGVMDFSSLASFNIIFIIIDCCTMIDFYNISNKWECCCSNQEWLNHVEWAVQRGMLVACP